MFFIGFSILRETAIFGNAPTVAVMEPSYTAALITAAVSKPTTRMSLPKALMASRAPRAISSIFSSRIRHTRPALP